MDFHGHINLNDNEMQKMVIQSEANFPSPVIGRMVFKDKKVWICVEINTGVPLWVPLSSATTAHIHTQSSAAQTWTITHNLGTVSPIVQVYDSTEKMIIPDTVVPLSNDQTQITFATAITGYAAILFGDPTIYPRS